MRNHPDRLSQAPPHVLRRRHEPMAGAEAGFDFNLGAGGGRTRDRAVTEVPPLSEAIDHLGWPP